MTTISLLLCFAILPFQNAAPAPHDHPYEVVLVNDKVLKIKEPPLFDGKMAHLVLLNGQKSTFPTKMIDQQKTLERNRRLAIHRQAVLFQKEQEAEAAAEKAAAAPAEPEQEEERGPIVLTSTRDLPSTAQRDRVSLPTSETGTEALGETKERRFTSNEDAYVARERMTKTADGYRIDAEVNVNQPLGVNNVQVKMIVTFENEERVEASEPLGDLKYGASKIAKFNIRKNEPIATVSYQVRYITTRTR
ncbi:hypothetical protein [Acanthopleuribacter pedis]|uniref:Uncharacterized protein n=1 Tax=Acanthopleuribacter pedis TaxID=442870 RepID=A0A8J7QU33_9BACT|nr:hypothetical protein [Acanthopleuribacter pedis]MBO1323318.1 hypothetical protein [Acanthopleuribacter pedis]